MKITSLSFVLLFCLLQYVPAQQKAFLRVYNGYGKKIGKGYFVNTTDSTILLEKGSKVIEIPATQIDIIKSKRTNASRILARSGQVVLAATVVVIVIYAVLVLQNRNRKNNTVPAKDNDTKKVKHIKPLKKYIINNSQQKWKEERVLLNQLW